MKLFTPVQWLTIVFVLGLALLTLLFQDLIPRWRSQVLFYAMLLGLLCVLKLSSDRKGSRGIGGLLNDFSPIAFIIFTYRSLGNMIQHLQPDVDSILIRIDFFLFGIHPTVWMERWITPWLTDLNRKFFATIVARR